MRNFLILLSLLIPFVVIGQSYFKAGMKWCTEVIGTHNPYLAPVIETVTLEESPVADCLMMYRSTDNGSSDREFIAFVRTEGDKILFRLDESEISEWYLLYDFGLRPGEGSYVYSPMMLSGNSIPYKTYIKCTDLTESVEPGYWSSMTLEEYIDETCSVHLGHGIWLKGLSSLKGVLRNIGFNLDGIGSELLEVYENGQIIYSNNSSSVLEITDSATFDVKTDGLDIIVTAKSEIGGSLYSSTGIHLGDYRFNREWTRIRVPARGLYILKLGNVVEKILIP